MTRRLPSSHTAPFSLESDFQAFDCYIASMAGRPHRNEVRLSQQDAGGALPGALRGVTLGSATFRANAGRAAAAAVGHHEVPPSALLKLWQPSARGMEGEQPHICSKSALSAGSSPKASPHDGDLTMTSYSCLPGDAWKASYETKLV